MDDKVIVTLYVIAVAALLGWFAHDEWAKRRKEHDQLAGHVWSLFAEVQRLKDGEYTAGAIKEAS